MLLVDIIYDLIASRENYFYVPVNNNFELNAATLSELKTIYNHFMAPEKRGTLVDGQRKEFLWQNETKH